MFSLQLRICCLLLVLLALRCRNYFWMPAEVISRKFFSCQHYTLVSHQCRDTSLYEIGKTILFSQRLEKRRGRFYTIDMDTCCQCTAGERVWPWTICWFNVGRVILVFLPQDCLSRIWRIGATKFPWYTLSSAVNWRPRYYLWVDHGG